MTIREADDVTVVADERHDGRAVVNIEHGNYTTSLHVSDGELRRIRDAINAHLSTPPADDVREAMLAAVFDVLADAFSNAVTERIAADVLTRLSATHEVRPRGTVTDAEHWEAVHRAVRAGIESVRSGDADRDVVRAVADQVLALEVRS